MCFFKSPSVPDAPPPPPAQAVIPPPPTVVPTQVSQVSAVEDRKKKIASLRFGLASTIKTGPRGIVDGAPELQGQNGGRQTLG